MAKTTQSLMFRAILEQGRFNAHVTRFVSELALRLDIPEGSPELETITLMTKSNADVIKNLQAIVDLMQEERNG
ncbi:MAG: hypothetical protein M3Y65_24740 [Pseudomonadota bacterium]|nr:hypothetical protein [Pseudomonadota bacterium]